MSLSCRPGYLVCLAPRCVGEQARFAGDPLIKLALAARHHVPCFGENTMQVLWFRPVGQITGATGNPVVNHQSRPSLLLPIIRRVGHIGDQETQMLRVSAQHLAEPKLQAGDKARDGIRVRHRNRHRQIQHESLRLQRVFEPDLHLGCFLRLPVLTPGTMQELGALGLPGEVTATARTQREQSPFPDYPCDLGCAPAARLPHVDLADGHGLEVATSQIRAFLAPKQRAPVRVQVDTGHHLEETPGAVIFAVGDQSLVPIHLCRSTTELHQVVLLSDVRDAAGPAAGT